MFLQSFNQGIKTFFFPLNITKHINVHFLIIYGVIIPKDSFFDVNIFPEFLESFYVKYGSFIPLSHTDVLEYLKKNGNTDLSHRLVDTHTHSWCFTSVLYDISHQSQTSAQGHFHICLIHSYKDLHSVLSDLSQNLFWEVVDIRLRYLKRSAVISLKGPACLLSIFLLLQRGSQKGDCSIPGRAGLCSDRRLRGDV